jgi:hypothetical protein
VAITVYAVVEAESAAGEAVQLVATVTSKEQSVTGPVLPLDAEMVTVPVGPVGVTGAENVAASSSP